jgi:hypothetical protein
LRTITARYYIICGTYLKHIRILINDADRIIYSGPKAPAAECLSAGAGKRLIFAACITGSNKNTARFGVPLFSSKIRLKG